VKTAYQNLRQSAQRRGKEFTLTLEEFEKFAIETNYIIGKGITKKGLHVDRINEDEGYHIWNIQVMENSDNIKKYLDHHYNGSQMKFSFRKETQSVVSDVPF
jgi:hypothetical protein